MGKQADTPRFDTAEALVEALRDKPVVQRALSWPVSLRHDRKDAARTHVTTTQAMRLTPDERAHFVSVCGEGKFSMTDKLGFTNWLILNANMNVVEKAARMIAGTPRKLDAFVFRNDAKDKRVGVWVKSKTSPIGKETLTWVPYLGGYLSLLIDTRGSSGNVPIGFEVRAPVEIELDSDGAVVKVKPKHVVSGFRYVKPK